MRDLDISERGAFASRGHGSRSRQKILGVAGGPPILSRHQRHGDDRGSLRGPGRRKGAARRCWRISMRSPSMSGRSTGRFFGYVVGSGEPVGALGELLAAALNQNVTAWRSAPAAVTIERAVVGWLAEAIGCAGFTGSLCGGGSAANLMGLAMAREAKLPANETGASGGVVYASEQVHMSIPKAVAHARHRPEQSAARSPPTTSSACGPTRSGRRSPPTVRPGEHPIAIVATVGTVVTGAIDPLHEIAEIARSEDLWLHVDGAYGVLGGAGRARDVRRPGAGGFAVARRAQMALPAHRLRLSALPRCAGRAQSLLEQRRLCPDPQRRIRWRLSPSSRSRSSCRGGSGR